MYAIAEVRPRLGPVQAGIILMALVTAGIHLHYDIYIEDPARPGFWLFLGNVVGFVVMPAVLYSSIQALGFGTFIETITHALPRRSGRDLDDSTGVAVRYGLYQAFSHERLKLLSGDHASARRSFWPPRPVTFGFE